jgi:hypothetical protein
MSKLRKKGVFSPDTVYQLFKTRILKEGKSLFGERGFENRPEGNRVNKPAFPAKN